MKKAMVGSLQKLGMLLLVGKMITMRVLSNKSFVHTDDFLCNILNRPTEH